MTLERRKATGQAWETVEIGGGGSSQPFELIPVTITAAEIAVAYDGDVGGAFVEVPAAALNQGDYLLNAVVNAFSLVGGSPDVGDVYFGEAGWTSAQVNDNGQSGTQPLTLLDDEGTYVRSASDGWNSYLSQAVIACSIFQYITSIDVITDGSVTLTYFVARAS